MPAPGNSTGGFDTLLGKIVVESGLVTNDELEQCVEESKAIDDPDDPRTLSDFLLKHDYVTRHQLDRLEKCDAKKSSQRIPGYRILKKLGSGGWRRCSSPSRSVSIDWWRSRCSPRSSPPTPTSSTGSTRKVDWPPS